VLSIDWFEETTMELTTVGETAASWATSASSFGETSESAVAFESATTNGRLSISSDTEG
jgi:hypothetical protein